MIKLPVTSASLLEHLRLQRTFVELMDVERLRKLAPSFDKAAELRRLNAMENALLGGATLELS